MLALTMKRNAKFVTIGKINAEITGRR